MGLARDRAREQGLAGARRPGHQHAARPACPGPVIPRRVAQVLDDLHDLGLHRGIAGHVSEPGGRAFVIDDPRLRLRQGACPAQPAQASSVPARGADQHVQQSADQEQGQQAEQHRQQRGGRAGSGADLHVVGGQSIGEAVASEGDGDGGGERLPAGQAPGDLARRADRHRADRSGTDIGHELGVGQRQATGGTARQGQQRHEAGHDSPREQPPPPRGHLDVAPRVSVGHAHSSAPSGARDVLGTSVSGASPTGADQPAWRWLYSGVRRLTGSRTGTGATLGARARACQPASTTSRMRIASTLSAAMPSGQRQLPTSA